MNEQMYIFCAESDKEQIFKLIKKQKSKYFINPSKRDIPLRKKARILYHNPSFLEKEQESFLLKKVEKGHKVQPLVDFLDKKNGYTDLDLVNGAYFLRTRQFSVLNRKRNFLLKRLIDISLSFILLILFVPLILLTAILIKLDSKGPIFLSQKRVGLFNKEFKLYKFRSMFINAEENGAIWARKNDKRITRIGKFIRKTRIDELPQLWNVLKGEMSLIGPRPERKIFIRELKKHIPYYEFRHALKPGITGWAQVNYPYGASIEDAQWKHKYDLYYIKYQSFVLDLKIIFLTIKTVIFGKGR